MCARAATIHCADTIKSVACEDGYRLHYRLWPAQGPPIAVLHIVNGMMSHSGWFHELACVLSESRITVVGADRRGSGLNDVGRGDSPSRYLLLSDLRKVIEQEECGIPVYVVGWCWGAVLAVNAALEFGGKFNGIVLLSPGLFPSEQIKRATRSQVAAMERADPDSCMLASPFTEDMFSEMREIRQFISADELAVRAFTPRCFRISQQMSLVATTRLAQLSHPLLLLLAGKDQIVNNATTLRAFQRLPGAALTLATLPCSHGMQLEAPLEIARLITNWLAGQGVCVFDHQASL
jgi:pimeloyl-ACP methyl ester carboxylesterase